jgi:uroporphyrin-III C-methyltransferase/precorrin-2 dehydrogenase/sirohydrochlorin ferrochelatase
VSGYYPVSLDLEGRPCTVLGGGPLAAEKVRGLLRAGARVTVLAAVAEAELRKGAALGEITWIERDYQPGDLAGAWLAIDASGDDAVNAACRAEAEGERVLLNVVDRTVLCDWIAPAIVHRGPLQVAISTSGESPFVASALRRRLERDLGEEWGPFVLLVGEVRRRLRRQGVPLPEQTAVYSALLRSDVRALLRRGETERARAVAEEVLLRPRPGRVWLVGAGPGEPGLLTLAAREVLGQADVVFHDALVDPAVLALAEPGARLVDVGKRAHGHGAPQAGINAQLLEAARQGLEVVRLKGGDPFVFARGGEEVAFLLEAGVDVRVVPGVSAATAAPGLAGIPLTMRGVASSVAFLTARSRGGALPSLRGLAAEADTLVVLMAAERLADTAAELAAALGPDWPAAVVEAAGTARQRVVRATLGTIAERCAAAGLGPPATLVTGRVVDAIAEPGAAAAAG